MLRCSEPVQAGLLVLVSSLFRSQFGSKPLGFTWHRTHQQIWNVCQFKGFEHRMVFYILYCLVHDDFEQINGPAEHSSVSALYFQVPGGLVSLRKAQH